MGEEMKGHIKFTYYHKSYSGVETDIEYKTENETLSAILEDFKYFLRGCGFEINGEIEIVEGEE